MLGPTQADHRLSDVWHKLLGGAARQQFGRALAALTDLLDASSAQLLHLRAVPSELEDAAVVAFDRDVQQPWFAQMLETSGTDHGLCAVLRTSPHRADALVVLRKGTPFGEGEIGWLELLVPHFRSTLELADTLNSHLPTTAIAAQLAKLIPTPCLLTDDAGRCIERNDAFGRMLEALSGTLPSGRVVFADPFLQGSWQQALLESHATATPQSLLANAPDGGQWKAYIVPFACINNHGDNTPRHLILALFEKFSGAATQTKTVQSSRPLTKAELEVLASLLLGQTAKVIARARGASVNTVRSQITAILGKTGHHTQKELIASFSTSAFGGTVPSDAE